MLQIKHKHHLHLPTIELPTAHPMQLSEVTLDNDELTQAISEDVSQHDDNWELNERPDSGELSRFWGEVEADIVKDPNWTTFNED